MFEYKPVRSGVDIGRSVIYELEAMATQKYQPAERNQAIQAVNNILQGRTQRTADELLARLEQYGKDRTVTVRQDILDFLAQKDLLTKPYSKRGKAGQYVFRQRVRFEGRSLKVIDQKLYDRAVRQGFPDGFFCDSHFDRVTFYCLPDQADFFGSELRSCKFAVCRVKNASLSHTRIYDTEFYSSVLSHVDMHDATLEHTRFRDCELSHVMLQAAKMKACSTIDCTMDGVDYAGATLDGCTFGRLTVGTISNLNGATITQGGTTEEECRQNRMAVYQALGIKQEGIL